MKWKKGWEKKFDRSIKVIINFICTQHHSSIKFIFRHSPDSIFRRVFIYFLTIPQCLQLSILHTANALRNWEKIMNDSSSSSLSIIPKVAQHSSPSGNALDARMGKSFNLSIHLSSVRTCSDTDSLLNSLQEMFSHSEAVRNGILASWTMHPCRHPNVADFVDTQADNYRLNEYFSMRMAW